MTVVLMTHTESFFRVLVKLMDSLNKFSGKSHTQGFYSVTDCHYFAILEFSPTSSSKYFRRN